MLLRALRPVAAFVAFAFFATPAFAAAPRNDDAAIEEAAKARYNEGIKLYNKKKYEEARAAFLQASALKRRPAATLMLARSALKAGRWLEAVREFDAYVAEQGDVPETIQNLVDLGRYQARQHLGRLRFDVPEGAEVTIDGEKLASVSVTTPIDVVAGSHTVVITHLQEKKTEVVEAVPNKTVDVKPLFVPKALVPTSDTRTRPTPGGRPSSSSASSSTTSNNGGATDQESSGPSILAPPQTTWPVYVSGAVGLGGLAAAAIFGGLAANSNHAVDVAKSTLQRAGKDEGTCKEGTDPGEFKETCITLVRNQRLANTHEGVFSASLIVGLSGTVIAVGWFLLAPKEHAMEKDKAPPPSSSEPARDGKLKARLVPWVGLTSGGAVLEGRF